MSRPRILLFGRQGQVAWELRRALAPLGEVTALGRHDVDLTDPAAVREAIRRTAPAWIVNAAAYTAVDKAESDTSRAHQINGEAPGVMAAEAARMRAAFVHYSTDYVFDGTKREPYVEEDPTHPINEYGRSKLAGEMAVRAAGGAHLVFRLCWVYANRGANFMLTMMRLAREREKLRVVADQFGCPTPARLIAEATALVLRRTPGFDEVQPMSGIYHLASSGQTTWHEFASAIVGTMPEAGCKCREIEAITTAQFPTPARRPAYSVLSVGKLEHTFGLRLPDWRLGLDLVLEK